MRAIRLSALWLTLVLSGCASTTQVITRTTTVEPQSPAHFLLLAAQTPEDSLRETWELACRPVFKRRGLRVALSHQEVPLWQTEGRQALLRWAQEHGADRVLIVNLTQLILLPPQMPERHELNPLNQGHDFKPTFRIPLGEGSYREKPLPSGVQEFPVDLLTAEGRNLWHGLVRTNEANDGAAIAQSQCTALRDTFVKLGLIP